MLEKFIEDLENRIDIEIEENLFQEWKNFADGENNSSIFYARRPYSIPSKIQWPEVLINETLDNFDKMALQQFGMCSNELSKGSGKLLSVRCNYGTSIIPSLFGAELFIMDKELNTLPTSKPFTDTIDAVKKLLDRGMPDLNSGLGSKIFEMGERYIKIFEKYSKIKKTVHLYHPDQQGPMDICEILCGSSIFLYLIEFPDLMKNFLELITETYIKFMKKWTELVPITENYAVHWSLLHKGHIMLRDDSAMNLSPAMFEHFILPYDQKLLDIFGGGAIHFCGRGDHFIEQVSGMDGIYAIAMSQPECNNMEIIFRNTVDKNIKLLGFKKQVAEETINKGRNLHGNVHCW
jgi:hypothetical protein